MTPILDRRPDSAGRRALGAFVGQPLAARTHVRIRWWSAPFPAVEAELPVRGRILEIGCGHGLFVLYAAARQAGRDLLGIDIDAVKIDEATAAATQLPDTQVQFEVGPPGVVPPGPWDAVVILDVLYLLPAEEQRALLTASAAELAAGGVVVIKEMGTTPRWKAAWNRFQETISVKVLRITAGDGPLTFVAPATMAGWLSDTGLQTTTKRLDRGRLHPHHLLIARRPR